MAGFEQALSRYDPVLGLETHVELATASKMFCGCATTFGAAPNTHTCPVCLGLPGSLPAVNAAAIEYAIRIGLALGCRIAPLCRFARKNYFYPDMPKNFQISQYDEPLCVDGHLDVELAGSGGPVCHRIEIERVHLEEDTGKSLHVGGATGRIHGATHSLVDYNRAGIPLVEIVTKPVFGTRADAPLVARAYVTELRELLRTLSVSDVRMEQGSLRCDVNTSLMARGATALGTRTETKNVNSLRSVERAVRTEIERQAVLIDAGERIVQETRHFHEDSGTTSPGRSKEQAEDYRYFPEPDLVPLAPAPEWVETIRQSLPELPAARRDRLTTQLGASEREVAAMTNAGVLDLVVATVAAGSPPVEARNWWLGYLLQKANEAGVEAPELGVSPEQVARIVALVVGGALTSGLARQVVDGVLAGEGDPDDVVRGRGLQAVTDSGALGAVVTEVIAARPDVADKVRAGNHKALGPLVGAVMAATNRQADAAAVRELLLAQLR